MLETARQSGGKGAGIRVRTHREASFRAVRWTIIEPMVEGCRAAPARGGGAMARKRRVDREVEPDNEPLTPEEIEEFKRLLEEKRDALLGSGEQSRRILAEDHEKLPDEVDLASAEYEAAFENRLRDREKYLLKKIEKALQRIEAGEYDECESCGSVISKKRLLARPEASLCIVCKEEQEQIEKGYLKRRHQREETFSF
jgi:DnaK suppressor protein